MKQLNELIWNLRNDFSAFSLDEKNVSANPFKFFELWLEQALQANCQEPNAMTLATATDDGTVDARVVLLRNFNKNGFSFFTNYKSIKGREIRLNKKVCLNFFWPEIQRQVRIRGNIKKLSSRNSDLYFASRPRESQIAAWASHQSETLVNRAELDNRYKEYEMKFAGKKIKRPEHWGGYIVTPVYIEFWQGRLSRLHDRITYHLQKTGKWTISRLNP